jgi:hypothetical protein
MTRRLAPLLLALCLVGCGPIPLPLPTPRPPTPTPRALATAIPRPSPMPRWDSASAIDARRIAREPESVAGANVVVRGIPGDVREEGGRMYFGFEAATPNRLTASLGVELAPPVEIVAGACYVVYGVVAGGAGRPALLYGYRADRVVEDTTGTCPRP